MSGIPVRMAGTWKIFTGDGRVVESHESPAKAKRAIMILNAHELKNGRKADHLIEPPVDWGPNDVAEMDLPDWARDALASEGL